MSPSRTPPRLVLVRDAEDGPPGEAAAAPARARDVDWTILMVRAQDGDSEAYLRLLEEIVPQLRALTSRYYRNASDIEDTVQDILLSVHAARHTYDPKRPFGPWLLGIANRRAFDHLRKRMRREAHETPLTDEHDAISAKADAAGELAADGRTLDRALVQLPPAQRRAIQLLKLKEMSLKDAATESGMSIGALKVATHRAMASLRRVLTDREAP